MMKIIQISFRQAKGEVSFLIDDHAALRRLQMEHRQQTGVFDLTNPKETWRPAVITYQDIPTDDGNVITCKTMTSLNAIETESLRRHMRATNPYRCLSDSTAHIEFHKSSPSPFNSRSAICNPNRRQALTSTDVPVIVDALKGFGFLTNDIEALCRAGLNGLTRPIRLVYE